MINLKHIICLLFLFIVTSAFGQNDSIKELMSRYALQKVAHMNDCISFLADKSKDLDTRKYYRQKALNLFIEKGEPYKVDDEIRNEGVKIYVSSAFRRKPTCRLIKDYLTGLINLRYSKVDIVSTEICEIKKSELQKIDDNEYVSTVCYVQKITGYKDNMPMFQDKTRRKIKIHIYAEKTIDDEGINPSYLVYLGDVTALETTKI